MNESDRLNLGNFRIVRGALYGQRCARDRSGPRRHDPPNGRFDVRVASIVATWKINGGNGAYASRAIANTAQRQQFPMRGIARQMREAIDHDVPLERVEELGLEMIAHARDLFARKRKLKPAA